MKRKIILDKEELAILDAYERGQVILNAPEKRLVEMASETLKIRKYELFKELIKRSQAIVKSSGIERADLNEIIKRDRNP